MLTPLITCQKTPLNYGVSPSFSSEVSTGADLEKLQHQLHGANRHRFGSKSEGMDQLLPE